MFFLALSTLPRYLEPKEHSMNCTATLAAIGAPGFPASTACQAKADSYSLEGYIPIRTEKDSGGFSYMEFLIGPSTVESRLSTPEPTRLVRLGLRVAGHEASAVKSGQH